MDTFLKLIAGIMVTVLLGVVLKKYSADMTLLLSLAACSCVLLAAMLYLKPVIAFISRLKAIGNLDNQMVTTLLKAVGIGLLSELTDLICSDAGNQALGKSLQILASGVILWLSLPLLEKLLDLMEKILGAI